jgi:hypothetical protein
MSNLFLRSLFLRSQERRLLRAGSMYRKGRTRVLWLNGVLFFGGSLFLLYNAVDYLLEPAARATSTEIFWFFAALVFCAVTGYGYGLVTWRQLVRTFGGVEPATEIISRPIPAADDTAGSYNKSSRNPE